MRTVLVVLAGLMLTLSGCPGGNGETCAGGSNFSNVRVDPGAPVTASSTEVRLLFDPGAGNGATLPLAYYQTASLEGDAGSVASVSAPDAGLLQLGLSQPLGGGLPNTSLRFGDRRNFTDCRHPGMDDVYRLTVGIVAEQDGGYTLSSSEQVELGAL